MTAGETPTEEVQASRWDPIALQLQELRERAGNPSFGEVAQRISTAREAAGASPHAARVARTTLYDTFRIGRTRLNVDFVKEIAVALGGTESAVDRWVEACAEPPVQVPEPTPAPVPAPTASALRTLAFLLLCVAVNVMGREFVQVLHLPVYLDMVGTAVAAVALGPWHGVAVGMATNVVGVTESGWVSIPFGLVNVAGALLWGYGVRGLKLGRTLARFFCLNIMVAALCTLIAVPLLLYFGGSTGHGEDTVTATMREFTHQLAMAVGLSNVLTSLGDKLISGFVALVVVSALPVYLRRGADLVVVAPPSTMSGDSLT